ncbi:MAG: hypothetical protein H8E15_00665 [Planctomycetes bacterium]|nr:hypothetical protein [Planctomycetota bacterium]
MRMHTGIVYKFFDLFGGFIEVRVTHDDEENEHILRGQTLSLGQRRNLVVERCILRHQSLLAYIEHSLGLDRVTAEAQLYNLAIAVNPGMENHASLRAA